MAEDNRVKNNNTQGNAGEKPASDKPRPQIKQQYTHDTTNVEKRDKK